MIAASAAGIAPPQPFAERNLGVAHDLVRQDAEINRLNRAISGRASSSPDCGVSPEQQV